MNQFCYFCIQFIIIYFFKLKLTYEYEGDLLELNFPAGLSQIKERLNNKQGLEENELMRDYFNDLNYGMQMSFWSPHEFQNNNFSSAFLSKLTKQCSEKLNLLLKAIRLKELWALTGFSCFTFVHI